MNYDNFFFPAENLEESKKFYTETLGLPVKFDFSQQGMIAFKVGDEEPAIILKDRKKFPAVKPARQ
jgi:predicted enzyme related to lactoylglutathione lyase